MALKTRKSDPTRPPRIMIYGVEGVGKTNFAAMAEKAVFITAEGGTDQCVNEFGEAVDEVEGVRDWSSLMEALRSIRDDKHDFKTLALDSADWIEGLAHRHIVGNSGKTITTALGGYGAGYRQSQNMHQELIALLEEIREKRGMKIIPTAHAHVKTVKDPESMEDYDAFEIKCHEYVSSLWREWVDALFFVRFRTYIHKSDEPNAKARAMGDNSRVLYTVKRPAFQAKNRFGMPDEMDFVENMWPVLNQFFGKGAQPESREEVQAEINELILKVTDKATRETIVGAVKKDTSSIEKLKKHRARIKQLTGSET